MDAITWFLVLVPMPAVLIWSLIDYLRDKGDEE